jgi:hypothetical protein
VPERDQDHCRVAVPVAVGLGGFDQRIDLGAHEIAHSVGGTSGPHRPGVIAAAIPAANDRHALLTPETIVDGCSRGPSCTVSPLHSLPSLASIVPPIRFQLAAFAALLTRRTLKVANDAAAPAEIDLFLSAGRARDMPRTPAPPTGREIGLSLGGTS